MLAWIIMFIVVVAACFVLGFYLLDEHPLSKKDDFYD